MHLTDLSVPKLRPGVYMDDRTPDFGIRVGKQRRSWIVVLGRKRVKATIGHYPAMRLSEARAEARKFLASPLEVRIPTVTFEVARDAFLTRYANPTTRYQVERSLIRHFGTLSSILISDVTCNDIQRCLSRIGDRPSEQLHAFRYARTLFNWSAKPPRKWVNVSPLAGYDPPGTDRKGSRILTDAELRAIWFASPPLFQLMILWGTRNAETCALERGWLRADVMTIPGAFTKNGRDHAIPVLPLAEQVLSKSTSNQYVFPGRWEGHITTGAIGALKARVERDSVTSGWQLRDIRRTFRSNLARLGVAREVCEVLINHAPPVLDEIYDRYDRLAEKREALRRHEHLMVWLLMSRD